MSYIGFLYKNVYSFRQKRKRKGLDWRAQTIKRPWLLRWILLTIPTLLSPACRSPIPSAFRHRRWLTQQRRNNMVTAPRTPRTPSIDRQSFSPSPVPEHHVSRSPCFVDRRSKSAIVIGRGDRWTRDRKTRRPRTSGTTGKRKLRFYRRRHHVLVPRVNTALPATGFGLPSTGATRWPRGTSICMHGVVPRLASDRRRRGCRKWNVSAEVHCIVTISLVFDSIVITYCVDTVRCRSLIEMLWKSHHSEHAAAAAAAAAAELYDINSWRRTFL